MVEKRGFDRDEETPAENWRGRCSDGQPNSIRRLFGANEAAAVLRPEPGGKQTRRGRRRTGHDGAGEPAVRTGAPVGGRSGSTEQFDGVLMTSANAVQCSADDG